ncbi:hypothetical protein A2947_02340 [Candidatus Peribacteria bacterium RIFCSPLOWO2_01_FULL_54_110]|nr:MAG: hypothetical protein A2947_02340 [Candidatus Peribacteria bacterium RIFCSPLOWO2_01_FULL_54_110]
MDIKPTFRQEALHDISQEEELTTAEKKAEWQPSRAKIEQLLGEQEVKLKLPKVYYSQHDPELQAVLPCEATFEDDLVEKYEVTAAKDGTVQMRVYPTEFDPFWVTIDRNGVKGSPKLLSMFLRVVAQPAQTIQQYAKAEVRGVMGNSEAAVSDSGISFHVTEGTDTGIAA